MLEMFHQMIFCFNLEFYKSVLKKSICVFWNNVTFQQKKNVKHFAAHSNSRKEFKIFYLQPSKLCPVFVLHLSLYSTTYKNLISLSNIRISFKNLV